MQALGVALTIGALMMQVHRITHQGCERMSRQHSETNGRMCFDDGVFLVAQAILLAQNGIRHPHFAQVMQKATQLDSRHLVMGQASAFCQ